MLSDDVDKAAVQWTQVFLNIMQEGIPCHMKRNLSLLTADIMRKRNRMFHKAKKSGKRAHYIEFKKVRNAVTTTLHEEVKFFNSLMGTNGKQFWLNSLINSKTQYQFLSRIAYKLSMIKLKANMLNIYLTVPTL